MAAVQNQIRKIEAAIIKTSACLLELSTLKQEVEKGKPNLKRIK